MYMKEISANDMIFYKEGDNIMSGGFSIDSILLHKGLSPMQTKNGGSTLSGGDSVSSIFKNLAVPAGLLYQPTNEKKNKLFKYDEYEYEGGFNPANDTVLPENIHSLLMNIIEVDNNKKSKRERNTRKHKKGKKSVTKSKRS